jgi:hypothetical protein
MLKANKRPELFVSAWAQLRDELKHVRIVSWSGDQWTSWLRAMTFYRAYVLDDHSNILLSEDMQAADDAAAIAAGWQLVAAHAADTPTPARGVEIWAGDRLVFSSHPRSI